MPSEQPETSEPQTIRGTAYVAISRIGTTYMTDSAREMGVFMWGKDARDWTLYKRVPFRGGSTEDIRDALETR